MYKFNAYVHSDFGIQVTSSITISSIAFKIFLLKYNTNNLPFINKISMYDDIKSSYFGGVTEVYRPYGEDLYYYDVNSLYPFAALNVMLGLNCVF